ncbi:DMT family transporter [Dactylosporangium sp. AC04546]|uniref:DMT family transporter n=1 Tax=Dactylosporangium sp. AC04546 TaxID=2862460 RepID=UPI001EDFC5F4|nr:DMT family transporter [Dactylosporangium sp. AC04546]WVK83478.1 DMT family transporter [Dactylosporangium sp. AC04546]
MTSPAPDAPMRRWLPAFLAVALIWGTSFMFIKDALAELEPVYIAGYRIALGALTLLAFLAVRRLPLPRGVRLWTHLFVFSLFACTIPFTLFGYAEQRVPSVLAGIWNGTAPLTTLLVTLVAVRSERPSRRQITGLLIGFAGVLVVLGVWEGVGGSSAMGQLMLFGAVLCYGIAFNYTRWLMKHFDVTPLQLSVGQLVTSTLHLLIAAPLIAGAPPSPLGHSPRVYLAIVALGVFGTGIAFALNFHVVRTAGVTTGSMVTYLPPFVAAVAGTVFLGETLTWHQPVGGLIVLAGVGASQGLFSAVRRRPREQVSRRQRVDDALRRDPAGDGARTPVG